MRSQPAIHAITRPPGRGLIDTLAVAGRDSRQLVRGTLSWYGMRYKCRGRASSSRLDRTQMPRTIEPQNGSSHA